MKLKKIIFYILKGLKIFTIVFGCISFIVFILAFTPVPYYMYRSLEKDPNKSKTIFIPEYIIMLGGGGMPSEDNLIRLYYTQEYSKNYQIPIIIIHPDDSICQYKMSDFLIANGILEENISFFVEGINTRSQVLSFLENYPEMIDAKILLISSPYHINRAIKCFNKAGFTNIHAQSAFEEAIKLNLSVKKRDLKGNKYIPEVNNTNARYTFWNYLKLEIICFREYTALFYYWLKNWI